MKIFLCIFSMLILYIHAEPQRYYSPHALAKMSDGRILVAEHTGQSIAVLKNDKLHKKISLDGRPYGLTAIPGQSSKILVTYGDYYGFLAEIDLDSGKVLRKVRIGHTPMAPLYKDGKIYIATRLHDRIDVVDYKDFKKLKPFPASREPHDLALSPDGRFLFVANHLPNGPSNIEHVTAVINVIELKSGKRVKDIHLPNGSINLRDMTVSPDKKYLLVASTLARFQVPTNQIEKGWISTHAMNIIDISKQKIFQTFLLDDLYMGAANPWSSAFSDNAQQLFISHNATNEISIINWPALLEKLKKAPEAPDSTDPKILEEFEYLDKNPANDLNYLGDLRKRVTLNGMGPKAILYHDTKLYVTQYFSDDIGVLETKSFKTKSFKTTAISLGERKKVTPVRKGHMLFSDATLSFQKWLACTTCHPDSKTDAVNWDLLNDGMGNPRNTKNLLYAHFTPPTTITGCRSDAYVSVRSGIRHIQFVEVEEDKARAIDDYLKSLRPDKSPYLINGKLSVAALRGREIFHGDASCVDCHGGKYLTNMRMRNVGTGIGKEKNRKFDVPTLHEIWRSRPYLNDGRAATIRDVITTHNKNDLHGSTSQLSEQELKDLIEYVQSL